MGGRIRALNPSSIPGGLAATKSPSDFVNRVEVALRPMARRSQGRARTCNIRLQRPAFCQLNYPGEGRERSWLRRGGLSTVGSLMGSLVKKRRKRMRKKKHRKMLKRTRFQRRAAGK